MTKYLPKLQFLGILLGACIIHGSLAQSSRSIDPEIQKAIDNFITDWYLPNSQISKIGLTIVRDNGKLLYSTGYGMANVEKGIPNSNLTQFLIGSTSKSFTSTVVVKVLHEKFPELGEAVLDTPIRKLMPSVNFTLIDRFRSEHTTFRDLLAHRMCTFKDDIQLLAEPFSTASEIVYRQRYAEEICGMRSEFQYNNQMYIIAGELIGILANKTYTELIQNLFEDLGMHNSNLTSASDDFSNMPFRGQPYYVLNNVSHPYNASLVKRVVVNNAAGGLFIPPIDMARYMRFHLNLGNLDGRQIIPEKVMKWLTKPSISLPANVYKSSDSDLIVSSFAYGLGFVIASYDGWQYVSHNGYFAPYHTLMSLFPSQKLGIFTSTNEGPARVNALLLHAFIFEILRGTTTDQAKEKVNKLWQKAKKAKEEKDLKMAKELKTFMEQNTSKKNVAEDIVGKYGNGVSGDAEIFERFNSQTNATGLYVSYGNWFKGWLENIGGSIYQISWDTDVIQDSYAAGDTPGLAYPYARVDNDTLDFITTSTDNYVSMGKFKRGVSIDTLPHIPWSPDSCGQKLVDPIRRKSNN